MRQVTRDRVADQAYAAIREQILTRALAPGQKLSVPRLAEELGASRSPVREAVQRLVAEGLATERTNHGAVVASPDLTALTEMYEVRAPLDGLAAELMTARATPADVAALTVALAAHREAFTAGDFAAVIQADLEFHEGIAHRSGNRELVAVLEPIYRRVVLGMLGGELSRWRSR